MSGAVQPCAAPLPVGETGGSKVKGEPGRGGSPDLHDAEGGGRLGRRPGSSALARSLDRARGSAPEREKWHGAEGIKGDRSAAAALAVFTAVA